MPALVKLASPPFRFCLAGARRICVFLHSENVWHVNIQHFETRVGVKKETSKEITKFYCTWETKNIDKCLFKYWGLYHSFSKNGTIYFI